MRQTWDASLAAAECLRFGSEGSPNKKRAVKNSGGTWLHTGNLLVGIALSVAGRHR
jgi:hypothetical protein